MALLKTNLPQNPLQQAGSVVPGPILHYSADKSGLLQATPYSFLPSPKFLLYFHSQTQTSGTESLSCTPSSTDPVAGPDAVFKV